METWRPTKICQTLPGRGRSDSASMRGSGDGKIRTAPGAKNVLIEPNMECPRDGVFIARTLVRARPRVPVRVMNVTYQDQVLREGAIIGHGQPAVGPATIGEQKPESRRGSGSANN